MKHRLADSVECTSLPPEYTRLVVIQWLIGAVVFAVVALVLFVLYVMDMVPLAIPLVCLVPVLGCLIYLPFSRRRARAFGYAELSEELLIRSGIMFQRVTVVPYGRMQQVQIGTGPLLSHFGLASVELVTASASTNASIPGVKRAEAERLRTRFTALGTAAMEGL